MSRWKRSPMAGSSKSRRWSSAVTSLVVQATGPRGDRERRQRTRPHPVVARTGPYVVRGHLHALPTADPYAVLRRRPPMVPLTEGSITYRVAGTEHTRHADTIIVNRLALDWLAPSEDESVDLPRLPVVTGLLVKDFTGAIHGAATAGDEIAPPAIEVAAVETKASEAPTAEPVTAEPPESSVPAPRPVRRRASRARSSQKLRRAG